MSSPRPTWSERFDGGSAAEEIKLFEELADCMAVVQQRNQSAAGAQCPMRTLHAKIVAGITGARLELDGDLPDMFRVRYMQPGAHIPALVRLSNASGVPQADTKADMRGIALRLLPVDEPFHDLLMTNFPASHARNARQFVDFAVIASGDKATMMERLLERFGPAETQRMLTNIQTGMRPCHTLAREHYWSRGAYLWGDQPVRYALHPVDEGIESAEAVGDDGLFDDLARRLQRADIRFRFAVQPYVSEELTPIEDASIPWTEEASTSIPIGTLVLPRQDLLSVAALATKEEVQNLAFNPWNCPADFRPLGNLNRARGVVYGSSAARWTAAPSSTASA
jgi:hypothetical protein